MKKILSLIGARPQFIKEVILQEEFKKRNIREILVHSGQHYDLNMSGIFFKTLEIKRPDYFLNIGSGKHGEMTGKIMIKFEAIVEKERPNIIIVYGDTNTTLAGAIVGAKLKIPVAHIEAGIRQAPKDMPEEINRRLVDRVSSFLFCPSQTAVMNLQKENIKENVFFVGDVMYDLFLKMKSSFSFDVFNKLGLMKDKYVLVTLHRDFNVDDKEKLTKILSNLQNISKKIAVVFPIHPRTKKMVNEFILEKYLKGIIVIEPVDYLNLMGLVSNCWQVITDSGGLQKEAYFAKKQAIVLMPDTGWIELVKTGWNQLANENNIYEKVFQQVKHKYRDHIYGDDNAGKKIVEIIIKIINNQ